MVGTLPMLQPCLILSKPLSGKYYGVCFIDWEIDAQRKQIICQGSTANK